MAAVGIDERPSALPTSGADVKTKATKKNIGHPAKIIVKYLLNLSLLFNNIIRFPLCIFLLFSVFLYNPDSNTFHLNNNNIIPPIPPIR